MKKKLFFFPSNSAEVTSNAELIEELQAERRATARIAHEMQLIRAQANQCDEQRRQEDLKRWAFERQEWEFTRQAMQIIRDRYEFE